VKLWVRGGAGLGDGVGWLVAESDGSGEALGLAWPPSGDVPPGSRTASPIATAAITATAATANLA
jgi:hypothetical protein